MWFVFLLVVVFLAFAAWVRFAPVDAAVWHVDPDTVTKGWKPNQYLVSDAPTADTNAVTLDRPAAEVMAELDRIALARPKVQRVAGDPANGFVTYVQRTKLMAYPDYISVRVSEAEGGGAKVSIYSRSRYGRSDFGMNKARVRSWLKALNAPQN